MKMKQFALWIVLVGAAALILPVGAQARGLSADEVSAAAQMRGGSDDGAPDGSSDGTPDGSSDDGAPDGGADDGTPTDGGSDDGGAPEKWKCTPKWQCNDMIKSSDGSPDSDGCWHGSSGNTANYGSCNTPCTPASTRLCAYKDCDQDLLVWKCEEPHEVECTEYSANCGSAKGGTCTITMSMQNNVATCPAPHVKYNCSASKCTRKSGDPDYDCRIDKCRP